MKASQPNNVALDPLADWAELDSKGKREKLEKDGKEAAIEILKQMTVEDIFHIFDDDGSGLISFNEFKKMLPYLDINICDAKAYRYFQVCDTHGQSEIDIDEFKVALYLCDPTSGNPIGFKPNSLLAPLDAFEIFNESGSGFLDEDEVFYALEYLQLPVTDFKHEDYFHKIDINHTGLVDFEEFRHIFVDMCNLRKELEDRGIDVPTFTRKKTLKGILTELLVEEEEKEALAIAEAKRYKKWMLAVKDKKRILRLAKFRAYQELRATLDAGGQVYVFGKGTHRQFDAPALNKLETKQFEVRFFESVVEMWKDRVRPQQLVDKLRLQKRAEEQEEKRDAERTLGALGKSQHQKTLIDPYDEAVNSGFLGLSVAVNTAGIWGRRIHHVAVSDSVIFALADTGEVYTWGGNTFWWHELQPDSIFQTKWRGDVTPRSQLLLGTVDKLLPIDASMDHFDRELTPDEKKAEIIKVCAKYYNCWEPPPNPATRMIHLEKVLVPKMDYDDVKYSINVRGKEAENMTKIQLMEELYGDVLLEKKLLGERAHKAIRELEVQLKDLEKRKKHKLAIKIKTRIAKMWAPLREVQAEQRASIIANRLADENSAQVAVETNYESWRARLYHKRQSMNPEMTARGNSLDLNLSGITPRAPKLVTPRGYESSLQISSGSAHACLIHQSGQLYSWGMGAAGRLGLDLTENGDPQADTPKPRLVQALMGRPVTRVSCGYSHTGCIIGGGEVYMWGSTINGKCGLGEVVDTEECYCSIPTRVLIGPEDRKARKISCGAAHTAIVTESGHLYIYGCGDSGRLGQGINAYNPIYVPTWVKSLNHERIASVSCGNTTTIALTEIKYETTFEGGENIKKLSGGRVYVAGSRTVLGMQCDVFTLLKEVENIPMKQASAGFQHTVLVAADGQLLAWGRNNGTCCGCAPQANFIEHPTVVTSLFTHPHNIGVGRKAYQSSTFNNREAHYAVNDETDGDGIKRISCTQQDGQSWLEIDLGLLTIIDNIKLWNRTDSPADPVLPQDLYSSRLFPCWVMIGSDPFSKECNSFSLRDNLKKATCKVKFVDDKRVSSWRCPAKTYGRYVRVQLEGYNSLSIAELQIFGYYGLVKGVGRVSYAVAGRDVTVAVVRPNKDPRDIEQLYKRAAYADSLNADILRQYETFALEYDKFGRGELMLNNCLLCQTSNEQCETCQLYKLYGNEIDNMPPVIGARRRRLKSIDDFLINSSKPDLEVKVKQRSVRPTKGDLRWNWFKETVKYDSWFSKKAKSHNHITRDEALEADPLDILRSFQDEDQAHLTKIDKSKSIMSKLQSTAAKLRGDDSSERGSSVGNSAMDQVNKRVSIRSESDVKPGDVLPSGHVVKSAVVKSITSKSELAGAAIAVQEEKQQAAKKELDKIEKKQKIMMKK